MSRLEEIRNYLLEITDPLSEEDTPLEDVVEAGTLLAAVINTALERLDGIKRILREEALEDLKHDPGSVSFEGVYHGYVTVSVPKPKLTLPKKVDPETLRRNLGDRFDLFFNTKTTYVPRTDAGELILRIATREEKDLLLQALEEKEGTPRVSFRKL